MIRQECLQLKQLKTKMYQSAIKHIKHAKHKFYLKNAMQDFSESNCKI